MAKVKTETKEEKEVLDAIKPALTRKKVVAIEALRQAIQDCECAGMPVYHGKKMITGAMYDDVGCVSLS